MAEIVVMPQAGNSVESCIVISWRVSEGDNVAVGDILCDIETDKATMEVESTAAGTVLKLYAREGDEVPVKEPLVAVGRKGETPPDGAPGDGGGKDDRTEEEDTPSASQEARVAGAEGGAAEAQVVRSFSTGKVRVSPRARKRAEAAGIDPSTLKGSGPGGRVIERDVRAAEKEGVSTAKVDRGAAFTDVPVTGVRKTIATRMLASLQNSAQLTLHRKADARALLAYRAKVKAAEGLRISINDMVNFVVTRVISDYPEMNAHFLDSVIRRFEQVDLGFAVDTPRGLLVPTIRGANGKSLSVLAEETRALAERAVAGTATADDLAAATFTVTNLGGLGVEHFTPVLNTPQVGILGVGSIVKGFDDDGEVIPRIGLSLTIDHRAVDGAPAARVLQAVAEGIANFELTLAR